MTIKKLFPIRLFLLFFIGLSPLLTYSQSNLIDKYPWLNAFVKADDCKGFTVSEYLNEENDSVVFLDIVGDNLLFDIEGTILCLGFANNNNCLEVNNILSAPISTYSCAGTFDIFICPGESINLEFPIGSGEIAGTYNWKENFACNGVGLPSVTVDGVTSYPPPTNPVFTVSPSQNTTYQLNATTVPATQPPQPGDFCWNINYALIYNVIIEENCLVEDTLGSSEQLTTRYPWLGEVLNKFDCPDIAISEYNAGLYHFISIGNESLTQLYFEDGTFYCQNASNFNCVELYALGNPKNVQIIEGNCDETETPNPLLNEYPWLAEIIDFDNCQIDQQVTEYANGQFKFLFVEITGARNLYFEDGTFYCSQTENYNCIELYGLTKTDNSWSCENGSSVSETPLFKNTLITNNTILKNTPSIDLKIYPNPTVGPLSISIENDKNEPFILSIYDLNGREVLTRDYNATVNFIPLNLQDLKEGMYLFQFRFGTEIRTKRIAIIN